MWTDPNGHVFTTGELVTAGTMNTYIKDNLAWLADHPRFRAYETVAQNIPNTAWTAVTLTSERYNVGSMHSTVTNTSRGTVQSGGAGKYLAVANLELTLSANGTVRFGAIWLNGTSRITQMTQPVTGRNFTANTVAEYQLAVGDYLEAKLWHDDGGALAVVIAPNQSPEFSMSWRSV